MFEFCCESMRRRYAIQLQRRPSFQAWFYPLSLALMALTLLLSAPAAFAEPLSLTPIDPADPSSLYNRCLFDAIVSAPADTPVSQLQAQCQHKLAEDVARAQRQGPITTRILEERKYQWGRHTITAHNQNYLLFYSYSDNPNKDVYSGINEWAGKMRNDEAKFQISLKIPLTKHNIFRSYDGFYFGLTIASWWQVYGTEFSAPFRESNYEPEFFYMAPTNWKPFNGNSGFRIGLSHQSNGRSQALSRSWNRVYASFLYEKANFAFELRPWYRIPEKAKETPFDPEGDDNPDIHDYLGYFDLKSAAVFGDTQVTLLLRNNLQSSNNKGAFEIGVSFPLSGHLKGFVQYFNGYGESLIDYDHQQQRIGIGLLLTDWL
jgi:Outer membrane phospholipase A